MSGDTKNGVAREALEAAGVERIGIERELDSTRYRVPQTHLEGLVVMIEVLAARAPARASEAERDALRDLVAARQVAVDVLAVNAAQRASSGVVPRRALLKAVGSVRSVLDGAARSTAPLRERVAEARDEGFRELDTLSRRDSRSVFQVVGRFEQRLAASKTLRDALALIVPEGMVEAIVEANAALGASLGLDAKAASPVRVEVAAVTKRLRRRTERYVAAVLGTARPEDPASVLRAERALEPLASLREDQSRARKAKAKVKVKPVVAAPVAAPVVVAPVVAAPVNEVPR